MQPGAFMPPVPPSAAPAHGAHWYMPLVGSHWQVWQAPPAAPFWQLGMAIVHAAPCAHVPVAVPPVPPSSEIGGC